MDQVASSELGISQKDLGIATSQNERDQIEQSLQREFGERVTAIRKKSCLVRFSPLGWLGTIRAYRTAILD